MRATRYIGCTTRNLVNFADGRNDIEQEMTDGHHDHISNAISATVARKALGKTPTGSRRSVGGRTEGRLECLDVGRTVYG